MHVLRPFSLLRRFAGANSCFHDEVVLLGSEREMTGRFWLALRCLSECTSWTASRNPVPSLVTGASGGLTRKGANRLEVDFCQIEVLVFCSRSSYNVRYGELYFRRCLSLNKKLHYQGSRSSSTCRIFTSLPLEGRREKGEVVVAGVGLLKRHESEP